MIIHARLSCKTLNLVSMKNDFIAWAGSPTGHSP